MHDAGVAPFPAAALYCMTRRMYADRSPFAPTRHGELTGRHPNLPDFCVMVCAIPNGRNADPAVVAEKMARLRDPHIAPLNNLADGIADSVGLPHGHVPYVNPDQGGTEARVLVLLDNPSTKAEAGTGSGLLTLDNNDRTARNCREAYERHGVPRSQIVQWNVAPFPVAGKRTAVRQLRSAPARFSRLGNW
ncbi:hypothetical protein ACIBF4_02180 [Rhodococcus coprophilus]|uniref:hypothetical protein n=1 Tax=Rhodococcus coprophilus TaxID=38310 RepID=UPI0037BBC962